MCLERERKSYKTQEKLFLFFTRIFLFPSPGGFGRLDLPDASQKAVFIYIYIYVEIRAHKIFN